MPGVIDQIGGNCRIFSMIYYIANYMNAVKTLGFYDPVQNGLLININTYQTTSPAPFHLFFQDNSALINPMYNYYMSSFVDSSACKSTTTTTAAATNPYCGYLFDDYYNSVFGYGCLSMDDFPYYSETELKRIAADPNIDPCSFANPRNQIQPFIVGKYNILYISPAPATPTSTDCQVQLAHSQQLFTRSVRADADLGEFTQNNYLALIKQYLNSGIPLQWGSLTSDISPDSNQIIYTFSNSRDGQDLAEINDMTIVGYFDDMQTNDFSSGTFKFLNSWGTNFGINGYGFISYNNFFHNTTQYLFAFT